jgi:ethanolamine utilization protein EutN
MFLARICGTAVATHKHVALEGCRLLVALRLEADGTTGAEPLLVLDWLGAGLGSTVVVSTDGDIVRKRTKLNTAPARLSVIGIVDRHASEASA